MNCLSKYSHINTVLFDFGGVLAEEGFREGLKVIARLNGIDEDIFFRTAENAIDSCGYLTGKANESTYWEVLRKTMRIKGDDQSFRKEILSRFLLREWMFDLVKRIRDLKIHVGILSDQTDWLEKINAHSNFFPLFDFIFNSYYLGKSKKDPTHYDDILQKIGVEASQVLFIDDNPAHCERAKQKGWNVIYYLNRNQFIEEMIIFLPGILRK